MKRKETMDNEVQNFWHIYGRGYPFLLIEGTVSLIEQTGIESFDARNPDTSRDRKSKRAERRTEAR